MMHRFSSAVAMLCLAVGSLHAQLNTWISKNPPNLTGSLHAVQMLSETRTYIVGDFGTVLRTTDGGNSWSSQQIGSRSLNAVYFTDSLYGMTCGAAGGAFKTTDGGNTWIPMNTAKSDQLNSILLIDKKIAFICGNNHLLLITNDSGKTWNPYPSELGIANIRTLRMLRSNFVVMAGDLGTVYFTFDTAKSFIRDSTISANDIYDVEFSDDNHATTIGEYAEILGTTDGGKHWFQEDTGTFLATATLNKIDSKDNIHIVAVGDYGTILTTTDGGTTWSRYYLGTLSHIKGLSMLTALEGIAVGSDGIILKTTDGGINWDFLPRRPQTATLRTIQMYPDGQIGIAAGGGGVILRSIDSGNIWLPLPTGTNNTFFASAYNGANGFLVGQFGTMYATTDSGATWAQRIIPTTQTLNAISFPTAKTVYAFGDSGVFLKSIDSGNYWVQYRPPSGDSVSITSCSFVDSLFGMITTTSGIFKTTDAGITWRLVLPTDIYTINSICIGSSRVHAYATALNLPAHYLPVVLYSTDAGETWHETTATNSKYELDAVFTSDGHHATAIGKGGFIIHITDNTADWNIQPTPTASNLYGISFGTINAGYSCGYRGAILRIDTDEEADVRNPIAAALDALRIERVYPNPAALRARVTYSVDNGGLASAEIFDVRGARVGSLDLGFAGGGEHSFDLNLADLSSGSYILIVRCGSSAASANLTIEH
ncbi:MAG TPA: YCF48-related protein [Candidatus Kapabacteria bacterium]|nr:YCF48-related protein [Candidatus Kapabacteria bacterium]